MVESSTVHNETLDLLYRRASLRSFEDRDIPADIMARILEAGTHAPSGGNIQPFSIIKISNKRNIEKFVDLGHQEFIKDAPVSLLFCIDWHRSRQWCDMEVAPFTANQAFRHFWISFQDTIIAAQSICVAAESLGLGSAYIGTVTESYDRIKEMFELPDGVFPIVLLCLGYPASSPKRQNKFGSEVIVHEEKYKRMDDERLAKAIKEKYPGRELPVQPNDRRLETLLSVCEEVGGEDLKKACEEKISKTGHITMAQYCFGLHYRADKVPKRNEEFLEYFEEYGFAWFKKYVPFKER
ncbi:MAG: nitroreductase family protein [Thermoplasmata archaeon]|nr:nitroreductase family protein [Thermoplasmata archaeon]